MARSLNKVELIGNLTKNPDLKYTPNGVAVINFTVATNREWKNKRGEKQEKATFTKCVAWRGLAEVIDKYLNKGSKIYVEGRLENKRWEDSKGSKHSTMEVIVNEMIMLGNRRGSRKQNQSYKSEPKTPPAPPEPPKSKERKNREIEKEEAEKIITEKDKGKEKEKVNPDDIPF